MPATSEQLWDAIDRIYNEDGTADKIPPAVIAKLIEFKMVELSATDGRSAVAAATMISGLSDRVWTIKELISQA